MAGTTPKLALRYPTASDADDVPTDLLNLATDIETALGKRGLLTNLPAAGHEGRYYATSDTNQVFRDNGTTWDELLFKAAANAAYARPSGLTGAAAGAPPAVGVGTKIQAGSSVVTLDASGNATITFPAAFSAGVTAVLPVNGDGTTQINVTVAVTGCSLTTFSINVRVASTSAAVTGSFRCNWFAVGG